MAKKGSEEVDDEINGAIFRTKFLGEVREDQEIETQFRTSRFGRLGAPEKKENLFFCMSVF